MNISTIQTEQTLAAATPNTSFLARDIAEKLNASSVRKFIAKITKNGMRGK